LHINLTELSSAFAKNLLDALFYVARKYSAPSMRPEGSHGFLADEARDREDLNDKRTDIEASAVCV